MLNNQQEVMMRGALSLNSYRDLLHKCEVEVQQLEQCDTHPEYDFILINLVLGLNHLFEWYVMDPDISDEEKQRCIQLFNPYEPGGRIPGDFKVQYDGIEPTPGVNHRQKAIRDLANQAKHFKQTSIEKSDKNYTCGCGEPSMQCGEPGAVAGQFDHYVYSVEIHGKDVDLLDVANSLLSEWHQIT